MSAIPTPAISTSPSELRWPVAAYCQLLATEYAHRHQQAQRLRASEDYAF